MYIANSSVKQLQTTHMQQQQTKQHYQFAATNHLKVSAKVK